MLFRITGGLFLLALAVAYLDIWAVPAPVLGVLALLAGIGLLAGI